MVRYKVGLLPLYGKRGVTFRPGQRSFVRPFSAFARKVRSRFTYLHPPRLLYHVHESTYHVYEVALPRARVLTTCTRLLYHVYKVALPRVRECTCGPLLVLLLENNTCLFITPFQYYIVLIFKFLPFRRLLY